MALYDHTGGRSPVAAQAMVHLFPRRGALAVLLGLTALLVDVGSIAISSAAATLSYVSLSGIEVDLARSSESALAAAALFVSLGLTDGSYAVRALVNPRSARLAGRWAVSLGLFLIIAYLFKAGAAYSRGALLTLVPMGYAGLWAAHQVVARMVRTAAEANLLQPTRTAVIGTQDALEPLRRNHLSDDPSVKLATFVTLDDTHSAQDGLKDLLALSQGGHVDQILIAVPWSQMGTVERLVAGLREQALPVLLLPEMQNAPYISRPAQLGGLPVFELKRAALGQGDLALKRVLDLMIASVALVVLSPLLLATAIAVKLDSPGPVFFRQNRHGFNNRTFRIFKFRSMTVTEDGPTVTQAVRNDPRVTRIGAFIRKTSIDELPQLFNVIRGEMSIVGPRPHAVAHNEAWVKLVEGYAGRHNILPGITGLAQVSGFRGQTDTPDKIDARVKLDLAYIERWSLALDVKIILKTVAVLFFQEEAF